MGIFQDLAAALDIPYDDIVASRLMNSCDRDGTGWLSKGDFLTLVREATVRAPVVLSRSVQGEEDDSESSDEEEGILFTVCFSSPSLLL